MYTFSSGPPYQVQFKSESVPQSVIAGTGMESVTFTSASLRFGDSIQGTGRTKYHRRVEMLRPDDSSAISVEIGEIMLHKADGSETKLNFVEAPAGLPAEDVNLDRLLGYLETAPFILPSNIEKISTVSLRVHVNGLAINERSSRTNFFNLVHVYLVEDGTGAEPQAALADLGEQTQVHEASQVFELHPNHPNPFNPSTMISFHLPQAAIVSLQVHDIQGRLVRALAHGIYQAGAHSMFWDGKDEQGIMAASGVYFVRLEAAREYKVGKMTLVR